MKTLRIALAQINSTVGDLEGNREKILSFYREAAQKYDPDLVVFPELALTGYPPEDLILRTSFLKQTQKTLDQIAKPIGKSAALIGYVSAQGKKAYNSAAWVQNGRIALTYSKQCLPNYGVFDENRYFTPGDQLGIVRIKGIPVGISICEDIWEENLKKSPCVRQARQGAKLLINISASPFYAGKFGIRRDLLKRRALQCRTPIIYLNLVGGQDELVFDGRTLIVDDRGRPALMGKAFEEDLKCVEFKEERGKIKVSSAPPKEIPLEGVEEVYKALIVGTRDYIEKNGFKNVIIGLSGGIDSALTACIASEAIGKDRVVGVTMPTRYSSQETRGDAENLAANLDIRFHTIPIEGIFSSFLAALEPPFKGLPPDTAEENLQSRARGMILMALSNKFNYLVLTTGNKSEMSSGYCSLYGDTAGGFAVIKDVLKTTVYALAEHINAQAGRKLIPESTIRRAPTAELKPDQKDQDTLPPYDILDRIIAGYVEEDLGFEDLLKKGFDRKILSKVLKMIDTSEYKRRQAPPGVKITPKALGRDRRMPLTNRFKEW